MSYPRLEVHLNKLRHNASRLVEQCNQKGIEIAAVTKVFCGQPEIAKVIAESGVTMLADSRIKNLKKMKDIPLPKLLLRIPMPSEIEELIEHVDISINSEIATIRKISEIAERNNRRHKILLMVDLGDLREGFWENEVIPVIGEIIPLKGVQLIGLAVNFGCYGGVIPEKHTLEKLINLKKEVEENYKIPLELLSGGNSNSLHLIWEDSMPCEINHLRLGEPVVMGKEDVYNVTIEGLHGDVFRLYGEIVEVKDKPSVPIGKRGIDAFGNIPVFEDKGVRKRAIVAIGRQDIALDGIKPKDEGVTILGASSDHLILDITDGKRKFNIGDIVELEIIKYGALLAAMTSEYVHKILINS